jgi:hypothetical protein
MPQLRDFIGRRPSPTPPPLPPDLAAAQQKAATALYVRLGTPAPDDGTVQVPVPPKTRSLHQAQLLARAFGTHAEMRALGIPEAEIASYLDPSIGYKPPTKATPVTTQVVNDIHFGPQTAPTVPAAPRPEETPPHFVQPGARPKLGQAVHAYDPANGVEWPALVAEVLDGFRDEVPVDSPDKVCRLVNPASGPDRLSAKTTYHHNTSPTGDSASPIVRSKSSWHRAAECEKGL